MRVLLAVRLLITRVYRTCNDDQIDTKLNQRKNVMVMIDNICLIDNMNAHYDDNDNDGMHIHITHI